MKPIKYLCFFNILTLSFFSCNHTFEKKVENSVREQLACFPESRLPDIYKNFFHDRYGPGHTISDTALAGTSLRKEIDTCEVAYMKIIEHLGWEKNYCRISTHALKLDYIPYDTYFNAFLESANDAPFVSLEKWKDEWHAILKVVDKMNINLPDYNSDKEKINTLLNSGEYMLEHSKEFMETYHPHYRIIKKDIFLKKIKPFLNK